MQLEQYIESRQLSEEFSTRLLQYPRVEIEQLCSTLQPSANALKGLLQLVDEISKRDSTNPRTIFTAADLQQVLGQEQIPRKEKGKKYRQVLELRRYPEVAKIRKTLDDNCKQLAADCNLRLQLPKDLEGDSLSVSFSVRSPEDLLRYAKRLEAAAAHTATEKIFSVLRGEY